jgi:hypothetical protein
MQLAKQLRSMSDIELTKLVRRRQVLPSSKDFLDLAQQLLASKSIDACLGTLTALEFEALLNLESYGLTLESLQTTGLIYQHDGKFQVLDSVKPLLEAIEPGSVNLASSIGELTDSTATAAIAIFETQLAITELLLDAEQLLVRVVNKNSFGLPDVKSLANQLHKDLVFARGCYSMAQRLGLLSASDSRWWLTENAKNWLQLEPIERWLKLSQDWLQSLGDQALVELGQQISTGVSLRTLLSAVFPLANQNLNDHLSALAAQAEWLGLSVSDRPTEALIALLADRQADAIECVTKHLPKSQRKLLAQADQTLVAPGPLPTDLEVLVRTFAQLEQVSLANTYRITAQSITYALECGLTESAIRATLAELTQTKLPQPVDYLLTQTSQRFGRIKIQPGRDLDRSIVKASDTVLLTEILNDQRLRPFAFRPVSANSLSSRFEPEVLYFGLRENGFLAIQVDENSQVISPKLTGSWKLEIDTPVDPAANLVASLRESDSKVGSNPSDDDLIRQLQLAIKNRATLKVYVTLRDGSSQLFEIKVSGLANGRLRGLDAKADAERVLPLSHISRIEF